jgi:hypothetical protein
VCCVLFSVPEDNSLVCFYKTRVHYRAAEDKGPELFYSVSLRPLFLAARGAGTAPISKTLSRTRTKAVEEKEQKIEKGDAHSAPGLCRNSCSVMTNTALAGNMRLLYKVMGIGKRRSKSGTCYRTQAE